MSVAPIKIRIEIDNRPAVEALSRLTPMVQEACEAIEQMGRAMIDGIMAVWTETAETMRSAEEAATRGAVAKVPRYQDNRPRWQTPYGPARKR